MKKIKLLFLVCLILPNFKILGQTNTDYNVKFGLGAYGITSPNDYGFKIRPNFYLGLSKNWKVRDSSSWLLGSDLMYNFTQIKTENSNIYKLHQLIMPLKLTIQTKKIAFSIGLVPNYIFDAKFKNDGDEYFNAVGTINYDSETGTIYKETLIDNAFAFQYLIGVGIRTSPKFELKVDYFNYFSERNFYKKFHNDYLTFTDELNSGSMNISFVVRL